MKSKRIREEEIKTVLGKRNYVILIIGSILIIIGYILMSGEGSTLAAYNPDIFSGTRIRIAPLLCLFGVSTECIRYSLPSSSKGDLIFQ